MADIQQVLFKLKSRLVNVSESASLDAQVLLAHKLGRSRAWVLAHADAEIFPEQEKDIFDALARLEGGEALPYVVGSWEFYGLDIMLSAKTLIPRPETELLVDQALAWLKARPGRRRALDIGCGSGCIAVALAVHAPQLEVVAVDISGDALQVARSNAAKHGVGERIHFAQADIGPPVGQKFDLICANLPYIPSGDLPSLVVARREPQLALDGGENGLALIQRLLVLSPALLLPGGLALFEIGSQQRAAVQELAGAIFPTADIWVLPDMSGHDRLLCIQTRLAA